MLGTLRPSGRVAAAVRSAVSRMVSLPSCRRAGSCHTLSPAVAPARIAVSRTVSKTSSGDATLASMSALSLGHGLSQLA